MRPTVHFIIPCFKGSKSINSCLRAITNQNFPKELYKISIIENGPKDGIEDLINMYSNCSYYYNPIQGRSQARNFLIEKIITDYIAYIDVDVEIGQNWLVECIQAISLPNCAAVTGPVYKKGERWLDGFRKRISKLTTNGASNILENQVTLGAINTAAVLFKTSVIKSLNGFDTSLKRSEDYELTHRILRNGYIISTTAKAEAFVSWDRGIFEYFILRYFEMGFYSNKIHKAHKIVSTKNNYKKISGQNNLLVLIGQIIVNLSFIIGQLIGRIWYRSVPEWVSSPITKKCIINNNGQLFAYKINPKYEILIIRGEPRIYRRDAQRFINIPNHIKNAILALIKNSVYTIDNQEDMLIFNELIRNDFIIKFQN